MNALELYAFELKKWAKEIDDIRIMRKHMNFWSYRNLELNAAVHEFENDFSITLKHGFKEYFLFLQIKKFKNRIRVHF